MRFANSIGNEILVKSYKQRFDRLLQICQRVKAMDRAQVTGNFGGSEGMTTKNAQQWQPQLIGLLHGKSASEECEAFFIWPHGHMAQGEW